MIGNIDWLVGNSYNLKLFKVFEFIKMVFIFYDFDYVGLVNVVYVIFYYMLFIKKVMDRFYWGNIFSDEDVEEIIL